MAVGDVYQVNIRYTMSAQRLMTTLHFAVTADTGAGDVAKEQKLADWIADQDNPANFINQLSDVLPDDCTIDDCTAQLIYPTRLSYRSQIIALGGTRSESNNQAQDVVITKRTDEAGRDQVGAIHMPGIPNDEMAIGLLLPAYKVDVLDAWDTLLPGITVDGTTWNLCILHAPALAGMTSLVTNMIVQDTTRVMQRRVVGRGV